MNLSGRTVTDPRLASLLKSLVANGTLHDLEYVDRGSYAHVLAGTEATTRARVAVKVLTYACKKDSAWYSACAPAVAIREMAAMQAVAHPNVIALQRVYLFHGGLALQMAHYTTSLHTFLAQHKVVPQRVGRKVMLDVSRGLAALHAAGYLHRDVKPGNILLGRLLSDDAVLADLGMARRVADPSPDFLSVDVITTWYAPPEVLLCMSTYGASADVWSLGITLLEVANGGRLFFETDRTTFLNSVFYLLGNERLDEEELAWLGAHMPEQYPCMSQFPLYVGELHARALDPSLRSLLTGMLCILPHRRLTMPQVLAHPYFSGSIEVAGYAPVPLRPSAISPWRLSSGLDAAAAAAAPLATFEVAPLKRAVVHHFGWHPVFSPLVIARVFAYVTRRVPSYFCSYLVAMHLSWGLVDPTDDPGLMFACFTVAHCLIGHIMNLEALRDSHPTRARKTLAAVGLACVQDLAVLEMRVVMQVQGHVPDALPLYTPLLELPRFGSAQLMAAYVTAHPQLILELALDMTTLAAVAAGTHANPELRTAVQRTAAAYGVELA